MKYLIIPILFSLVGCGSDYVYKPVADAANSLCEKHMGLQYFKWDPYSPNGLLNPTMVNSHCIDGTSVSKEFTFER